MYVDKSEYEKLESIQCAISEAWNAVIQMQGNCRSIIIGHDINGEVSTIESYLVAAAQQTQKLKLAYEKELKK